MRFEDLNVAIIGGSGQMGEWFSRFLITEGANVTISSRHRSKALQLSRKMPVKVAKNNVSAIANADLIILSVPVRKFEGIVKEIGPEVNESQHVIDITSVKEEPVRLMHRYIRHGVSLGTHPMFGPSAQRYGQNFILTPTNSREMAFAKELGMLLQKCGFRVHEISPAKHDKVIGNMLSLTHFVGLVTASSWKELGIDDFSELTSTSFRFLFEFVKSVLDSNPDLYSYLQMEVPRARRAQKKFIEQAESWSAMINRRDIRGFSKQMLSLRSYMLKIRKDGDF